MVDVNAGGSGSVAFDEALRIWHAALEDAGFPNRLEAESTSLLDAVGRVPASIARTKRPCPTYRAAAMDGYAIRSVDTALATAGAPVRLRVGAAAIAIDTGGAMPDGFDAVVPFERAMVAGETIIVDAPQQSGRHVRLPGEDVPPGVAVGWPGAPLRPLDCAALVATGCTTVEVVRRPRLAVIPTGDEVTPLGTPPRPGTVVDSNSLMIAEEARALGAEVTVQSIVHDDDAAIERAIRHARSDADVVAVLAGSSRGRRDRGPDAIAAVGSVDVRGIATRPGKPVLLGHAGHVAIVDLPGYPVACHFAVDSYVAPLLRRLGGLADPMPRRARLAESIDGAKAADEWRAATLLTAPGSPRAIVAQQGDVGGALYRLARADVRFHLKRGIGSFGRHASVPWTPLRGSDEASRPLFVGPYDPLIEEIAALGGFRCSFTADERGSALDDGFADAVGLVVREGGFDALRSLAGSGRKMMPIGLRSEGTALGAAATAGTASLGTAGADPWAAAAAVAAGVSAAARCSKYVAQRFGVRFEEGPPALYAIVWEDRPGHRFPWGIVLSAAISALEGAGPELGWKSIGMKTESRA